MNIYKFSRAIFKLVLPGFIFGCSLPVIAESGLVYVCSNAGQERLIKVHYPEEGVLPCEVLYEKGGSLERLWHAENSEGYCESKAAAFVEKQQGWGWDCLAAVSTSEAGSEQAEED
jgi:hypothetical protein